MGRVYWRTLRLPKNKMAKLDTKQRRALPDSQFAIPEKAPGSGSYPIPDENHARDALSRVSANGSEDEKSRVHAAVKRKFPNIAVGGAPPAKKSMIRTALEAEASRRLKK